MTLVLSLFPGIGLLDMAFESEGFCVVRGPDLLWGGDIRRFHPPAGRFDGVIGGPPCQAFSRLRHLVEHNGFKVAEDLIPEYERVVAEASPAWFLMENVTGAPEPVVPGYVVRSQHVNNRWLRSAPDSSIGSEQSRPRRFCLGTRGGQPLRLDEEMAVLESPCYSPAVCATGARWVPVRLGGIGKPKKRKGGVYGDKSTKYFRVAARLQGLPDDFDLPPFTVAAKVKAVGNGVPIPMGRAVARAVRRALGLPVVERTA